MAGPRSGCRHGNGDHRRGASVPSCWQSPAHADFRSPAALQATWANAAAWVASGDEDVMTTWWWFAPGEKVVGSGVGRTLHGMCPSSTTCLRPLRRPCSLHHVHQGAPIFVLPAARLATRPGKIDVASQLAGQTMICLRTNLNPSSSKLPIPPAQMPHDGALQSNPNPHPHPHSPWRRLLLLMCYLGQATPQRSPLWKGCGTPTVSSPNSWYGSPTVVWIVALPGAPSSWRGSSRSAPP